MSEGCCATGQGVANPVRSGSGSGDESVAENFLRISYKKKYFLRITKIDQIL